MILAHEQDDTEIYFIFSSGSNGAGKNQFVFQFAWLQPHLYIKIHAPHTHISTILNPLNCCLYCDRSFVNVVTSP